MGSKADKRARRLAAALDREWWQAWADAWFWIGERLRYQTDARYRTQEEVLDAAYWDTLGDQDPFMSHRKYARRRRLLHWRERVRGKRRPWNWAPRRRLEAQIERLKKHGKTEVRT